MKTFLNYHIITLAYSKQLNSASSVTPCKTQLFHRLNQSIFSLGIQHGSGTRKTVLLVSTYSSGSGSHLRKNFHSLMTASYESFCPVFVYFMFEIATCASLSLLSLSLFPVSLSPIEIRGRFWAQCLKEGMRKCRKILGHWIMGT